MQETPPTSSVPCNSYELVKDAEAVNVRTGKTVRFKDYDDYADFVCSFMEKFAPPKRRKKPGKEDGCGGVANASDPNLR